MAPKVRIRPPELDDELAFLAAVSASRSLHHPWIYPPTTVAQYRAWLRRIEAPTHCGFLVLETTADHLVGVINISEIVHGHFRSGYLGYYAFAGWERKGYMRAGLKRVVGHAFKQLKLHRLEANIQPNNLASIALARTCGFSLEGYSPRYLKIGGRWRDHERWAIVAS